MIRTRTLPPPPFPPRKSKPRFPSLPPPYDGQTGKTSVSMAIYRGLLQAYDRAEQRQRMEMVDLFNMYLRMNRKAQLVLLETAGLFAGPEEPPA